MWKGRGKKKIKVLYSAIRVILLLELNNARLRTNEKTEQVLVAAVHYCVFGMM